MLPPSPTVLAAAGIAALAAPALAPFAARWGLIDRGARTPDGRPMPRVGGLAVLAALVLLGGGSPGPLLAIGVIGLHDDRHDSSPAVRLLAIAALSALVAPATVALGPWTWDGLGARALAALWITAVVVAFDFADGIDGWALLAGAVAAAAAGVPGAPLLGACLGVGLHNRPPARLFLGDAGSNVIGLAAATALAGDRLSLLGASAAVAVPLLDLGLAALRRLRRRAPFSRDRDHLHHRARTRGPWAALAWLGGAATVLAWVGHAADAAWGGQGR